VLAALLLGAMPARAQDSPRQPDPFTRGNWHFEADAGAGFEAWNYNTSHEDLFSLSQTVGYALRDGLVLRAGQRFAYVSQRAEDAVLLGLTFGPRWRIGEHGPLIGFLQGDLGISYTAIATPPRGTRFNYLAIGGGGVMVRLRPRAYFVTTLLLTHVSNGGLRGRSRNPDLEAIGPTLGVCVRF
jgi:hypothetical protein